MRLSIPLFKKIKSILKKYIDIDEDFINILAADIIFTYFQDKLGMTHYLLIVGDNNTGKSNILLVFSFLGYRPILDNPLHLPIFTILEVNWKKGNVLS